MTNDNLLETIERYLAGQMPEDEQAGFEALRHENAEVDAMVVEHQFFLQQLDQFGKTKGLRHNLNEIHADLTAAGEISEPKRPTLIVYLFHRYKRTAAIAASIAGITALAISVLVSSLTPVKQKTEIELLSGEIKAIKNENRQQDKEIEKAKQLRSVAPPVSPITYRRGGTGFLIDAKGWLVTKAHVIQNAKNIAVQNSKGKDLHVEVAYVDADRDIAILKITDTSFRAAPLPYGIKHTGADIAEPVYTLGFPRNDMVYGEGYLAAKTGFNGDTLTCQIAIAANPGNSGGPVLNRNGEVVGILSARQTTAEGVVFATQARYIFDALKELQKDSSYKAIKIPAATTIKNLDRVQQVKKIADYVYLVKVS